MTHPRLRTLSTGQRGFTLIEMVVVVALIGIIAAGIAMTISQVMAVNSRTSSKMVALRQVQQAGDRVSKDVLQSKIVDYSPSEGKFLVLEWIQFEESAGNLTEISVKVEYDLVPMAGDLSKLVRAHSVGGGSATMTQVAQYIDPDKTSFLPDEDSGGYIFRVSASVGLYTETRDYKVEPRPDS